MKRSLMACAWLLLAAALAACRSNGDNMLAAHDKTVEYYRVFDIRTDASAATVAKAASTGIERNVKDAVIATPPAPPVGEVPGRFRMAAPGESPSAAPAGVSSCEGASWTAKAAPVVRGGDNMNLVACLFPYRSGYHLDMYAVFTKPEGGWLAWPRQLGGAMLGTPEKFTEATMMDLVRAIREGTGANVSLVEAKPELAGAPWLGSGAGTQAAAVPVGGPAAVPAPAAAPPIPAAAPAPGPAAPATAPAVAAPPAAAPPAAPALPAAASVASTPPAVPAAPATLLPPAAPAAPPVTQLPATAPAAAPAPATAPAAASPVPSPGAASATTPDGLR